MLELFEVVSKVDSPLSLASSVTVKRKALFAPVSELIINENVPSPLSVTVALTPDKALSSVASPDKVLLESFIVIDWALLSLFVVNVLPDQDPKSILIDPLLIVADLLEKPENSIVCDEARALTDIDASKAFAKD